MPGLERGLLSEPFLDVDQLPYPFATSTSVE